MIINLKATAAHQLMQVGFFDQYNFSPALEIYFFFPSKFRGTPYENLCDRHERVPFYDKCIDLSTFLAPGRGKLQVK